MSQKRKNKFRHNKKRNTAFLFEVLVKELTKASLQKNEVRKNKVVAVLKKHFSKGSVLHKELDVYRALSETRGVGKEAAERMLLEAKRSYALIPMRTIFDSQSEAIADISKELGPSVYSNFVPNYKDLATLAQIFNQNAPLANRVLMEQKQIEVMTEAADSTEAELKHVSNLTFKTFTKRFNKEYSGKLHEEQASLLNKFIYSFADNGLSLSIYLNEEIGRLKEVVSGSMKLEEIATDKNMLANAQKVMTILESFKDTPLDEQGVKKILKIQELAREVSE